MTTSESTASIHVRPDHFFWEQTTIAQARTDFADPLHPPRSQREYAQQQGIPRSTLGHWLNKQFPDDLDPAFVSFFCSRSGLTFLRQLVVGLLVVFHHENPVGLRPIGHLLELVGLDHFVGTSIGALYDWDCRLQDELIGLGTQERHLLAPNMPHRDIPLCGDENFHGPQNCLVAIEPVSNFILLESYQSQRDHATWAKVIREGIQGLDVHIVAFTSDQAAGLIKCAQDDLGVRHWPELFHLQRDLAGPVCRPLGKAIQEAQQDLDKVAKQVEKLGQTLEEQPQRIDLDHLFETVRQELQAHQHLEEAQQRLQQALQPIREVSASFHPFERTNGQAISPEAMQKRLSEAVARVAQVVEQAGLGQRAQQAVSKAQEWVVVLVGCLGSFAAQVERGIEALDLSKEAERLVRESLLGSYYWEKASQREQDGDERIRLKELARRLSEQAWGCGGALAALPTEEKQKIERVCRERVGLFCRSSSCVEGRNGRLSLFHHGQTRLSQRRLAALTTVHNYVVRRADGTTAAERFFGQKQRDFFTLLLDKMPDLPRPAAKRPNAKGRKKPAQTNSKPG